jgi:hypothetical protein
MHPLTLIRPPTVISFAEPRSSCPGRGSDAVHFRIPAGSTDAPGNGEQAVADVLDDAWFLAGL